MNQTATAPRLTRTASTAAASYTPGDAEKQKSPELDALRTLYATATRQHVETRQSLDAITAQLAEVVAQLEKMQTAPPTPTPSANAPAATGEHFIAHRVELELLKKPGESKSKRYYKIMGEFPYQQHGARVWSHDRTCPPLRMV
jgi:hypothetical protein